MVLSTIHTNDAAGTIPRLLDIGVKPETVAPALTMAMGQRLLRRLCQECRTETALNSKDLQRVREAMEPLRERFDLPQINESLSIFAPGKSPCEACGGIGYRGRIGVYEVFKVNVEMERAILTMPAVSDIRDMAVAQGMVTMLQDGYLKLFQGITSLEEIRRILG
jgi:type II secretory ATPase GspE/PulE/Tfp pilus assembly ATPase PilB-like protein